MSNIVGNLLKTVFALIAVPGLSLLAYDTIAIRPRLAEIDTILSNAHPQDADPPRIVRDLIDANAGSPQSYATRLVVARMYSKQTQSHWHVRNALWRILLPPHFDRSRMYGLYAALAHNGTDHGLSNFARREYGKALNQISPMQAANAVAMTHAPIFFQKNPAKLDRRAKMLLEKSGHAP